VSPDVCLKDGKNKRSIKSDMSVFFYFYTVYCLAHFYAFYKIKSTFSPDTTSTVILSLILISLAASPHLIHLYSHRGPLTPARVAAYSMYIWMSLLFLFISVSIPLEAYNLAVQLAGSMFKKDLAGIMLSSLPLFFIPVLLSVALNIYGYFEAQGLRVKKLTVETSKLPEETSALTIAHISDLHLGIIHREKRLEKVLKEIEPLNPDLIVSTGDFLDGELIDIDHLAERIKKTTAKLGKFAVTGNHEFYAGIKHSLKFLRESGFTVLRGEGRTIQNLINIAGIDDPTGKYVKLQNSASPEKEILSGLPADIFTLLLKHRPSIDRESIGLFDLQLSGHAHEGQIFPFSIVTKLHYLAFSGHSRLPEDSLIYVSKGAGTAGPPIRVLAHPEITIFNIVPKKPENKRKVM
jgi:predicted MPP superfamily phosphohydrolase